MKTCIHIVHSDGRLIPFDTYNLFNRDDLERTVSPLRAGAGGGVCFQFIAPELD